MMKEKLLEKLKRLDVVIASHIFATGPALELEEFLKGKVRGLVFIGHPFAFRKERNSFFRLYQNGKLIKEHKAFGWRFPEALLYLKEVFYTLLWTFKFAKKVDLFIGSDNSMAYLGLVLKKLRKVKDVILYTIDYLPQRFKNPVFNFFYYFFDKQCLRGCKIVWNVSSRISAAREKFRGLTPKNYSRQIVVPLGAWYDRIPRIPVEKKEKYTIVFMGHILEKQGLGLVIESLPLITEKIPEIQLKVIGTGPYLDTLKDLAGRLGVSKKVEFMGYIENHEEVEKVLANATVSVATYKPDPESFTYFADPGKIKNYLAAGLPVFLTEVPAIARTLEKEKCGVICEYDFQDFAEKMTEFLNNRKKVNVYSKNAREFAKDFDWNKVYEKALSISLD